MVRWPRLEDPRKAHAVEDRARDGKQSWCGGVQRFAVRGSRTARMVLWIPARSVVMDGVTTTSRVSVSSLFIATCED